MAIAENSINKVERQIDQEKIFARFSCKVNYFSQLKGVLVLVVMIMTEIVTWNGNDKETLNGLGKSSLNEFSETHVIQVHLVVEYI